MHIQVYLKVKKAIFYAFSVLPTSIFFLRIKENIKNIMNEINPPQLSYPLFKIGLVGIFYRIYRHDQLVTKNMINSELAKTKLEIGNYVDYKIGKTTQVILNSQANSALNNQSEVLFYVASVTVAIGIIFLLYFSLSYSLNMQAKQIKLDTIDKLATSLTDSKVNTVDVATQTCPDFANHAGALELAQSEIIDSATQSGALELVQNIIVSNPQSCDLIVQAAVNPVFNSQVWQQTAVLLCDKANLWVYVNNIYTNEWILMVAESNGMKNIHSLNVLEYSMQDTVPKLYNDVIPTVYDIVLSIVSDHTFVSYIDNSTYFF